ncbi:phage portal protein [Sporosarcina sp. FSL K6-1522]|uniref:phage portal protein n=1 Tax=Sporosarcina sp. FSL K6-1522 TaxID=2921554 RepID=UPI00315A60A7
MGFFDRFKKENKAVTVTRYEMMTDSGNGFYAWNGKIYQSDVVRSAIRPKAKAVGKAIGKHIRRNEEGLKVNPDAYMRFLLEEPNPYMTGQQMQEKLITHLELNNNAFAYINRDENGYPTEIYPITATSTDAIKDSRGQLYLKFTLVNGKAVTFRYTDIIHLRKDFNSNELFGDSPAESLAPLMEIINTTDQGIVKAIKNSNIVKWLLKFNQTLRPEDLKKATKQFVNDYLNIESDSVGAAATDAKMDAIQVDPKDYVPNEKQMNVTVQRVYAFFATNEKIVSSSYSENDWVSYYENAIESDIVQLSDEFTRKLFTRRERGFGNRIMFESSNLAFATLKTKMDFVNNGIDRGYVNANEGRDVFGLAPIEGGDIYVRRLDMGAISESGDKEEKKEDERG